MKKFVAYILIVFCLLLCSCSNNVSTVVDSRCFSNDLGDITVTTHEDDNVSIRTYTYEDLTSTRVEMYRVKGIKADEFDFYIGDNAIIRVASPEGGFNAYSLLDDIPQSSCYYIDSDNYHYWIYMPKTYKLLKNHSLKYIPQSDGKLKVYSNHFVIDTQNIGLSQVSDFMIIESSNPLFDWGKKDLKVENFMKYYNLDSDGHWCFDGYYFPAAETYEPHGDNVLYFCVDSYIIKSFNAGTRYNGCKLILPAMIDTMLMHQNEWGYLPTYSKSIWLLEDYGIDAGFYDTRFNTDFFDIVINANEIYRSDEIKNAIKKYAYFYLDHAKNKQINVGDGYFVADYYNPECGKLTHASLNHNLAELELCFKFYDLFEDEEFLNIASSILKAIDDTKELWIMADNNLEYAILPDMSFGYDDYPYLTYNDLYDTQNMLEDRGLGRSEALDYLMEAKKLWMDSQGINAYKQ